MNDQSPVTYVTVMTWGYGDERDFSIPYAGESHSEAMNAAAKYKFPDPYNNWGYLQTWQDGKMIREEEVR